MKQKLKHIHIEITLEIRITIFIYELKQKDIKKQELKTFIIL